MAGRCDCQRPCNCCSSSSDSVAVAGGGSAGSCFTPSVRYSTDAGNRARAGSDGAVFADACAVLASGYPADVDDDGCLIIPPACILDYNGDPIDPDDNGCIQLPASPPVGDLGCGLRVNDDDETEVHVSSRYGFLEDLDGQSFAGDVDQAGDTICTDFGIKGLPDHTTAVAIMADTTVHSGLTPVADTYNTAASPALTLVNPSGARRMFVTCHLACMVDLVTAANGGAQVRLQQNVDGGGWTTIKDARWPEPTDGGEAVRYRGQVMSTRIHQVAAGGSISYQLRVQIIEDGTGVDFPGLVTATVEARLVGTTI